MTIGFVYLLSNESMPGLFKVGCTNGSPHERTAVLSRATGVPTLFDVMVYIEIDNAHRVEQLVHKKAAHLRNSGSREFFSDPLFLGLLLLWHPDRLAQHISCSFDELVWAAGKEHAWQLDDPWGGAI